MGDDGNERMNYVQVWLIWIMTPDVICITNITYITYIHEWHTTCVVIRVIMTCNVCLAHNSHYIYIYIYIYTWQVSFNIPVITTGVISMFTQRDRCTNLWQMSYISLSLRSVRLVVQCQLPVAGGALIRVHRQWQWSEDKTRNVTDKTRSRSAENSKTIHDK